MLNGLPHLDTPSHRSREKSSRRKSLSISQLKRLGSVTAENNALGKALGERNEQVQGLVSNAAALEQTIAQLQFDTARQDGELRELRNSTSWKLTGPLRFFGRLIGRG